MTMDLLIELAWKSVLCAGFTLALLRLFRSRSAAEKALVAHLGLVALILLPLASLWLPSIELPAPAAVAEALPILAPAEPAPPAAAISTVDIAPPIDWSATTFAVYFVPLLALLAALAVAVLRLRRVRARAEVVVDPLWLTALAAAQRRLGFKHGTALLTSGELNAPVSWGIVRPVIIVDPAAAAETGRAEAIIAHELAHVVRLDWLKLIAGRLAVAIFWFNPLVWALARRCHQYCEEAADDAVLESRIDRADYADLLLGAARHANRPHLLAANGVAPSRSSMAQRIAHVLDPGRPRGAARLGWAAGSLAAAITLNGVLAAAEPIVEAPFLRQAGAGEAAAAELARLDSPQARTIARAMRLGDWNARRVQGNTLFDEPAAARPLLAALRDDQPAVRRIALWGLSEMRPAPAGAAAPVARLLTDPAAEVREEAARALGDLGSAAHAADVAALLRDPNASVRRQAAHALGDLQDPATAPALEAALNDPDPSVRDKAAWALRQVREAETILRRYRSG